MKRSEENKMGQGAISEPKSAPNRHRFFVRAIQARFTDVYSLAAAGYTIVTFILVGLAISPTETPLIKIFALSFCGAFIWTVSYAVCVTYADYVVTRFEQNLRGYIVLLPVAIIVGWITSFGVASLVAEEQLSQQTPLLCMAVFYTCSAFTRSIELANFVLITENPIETEIPFFRRLRVMGYAPLIRIEAQDHYLHVVMRDQQDLIRLRLVDATEELSAFPGMRVHRSHWVALDEVVSYARESQALYLQMSNGDRVPVSQPNREKVMRVLAERGIQTTLKSSDQESA